MKNGRCCAKPHAAQPIALREKKRTSLFLRTGSNVVGSDAVIPETPLELPIE
jgi:hypothetical protein